MDNHAIALEPCPNPWCEAGEREGDFRPQVQYSNFGLVYVACTSCTMAGPTRQHEVDAIAAWNTRTTSPAPVAVGDDVVERVAKAIDPEAWLDHLPIPTRADTAAFHERRQTSVINARAALPAMPVQAPVADDVQPVAWMYTYLGAFPAVHIDRAPCRTTWTETPLYAAQPPAEAAIRADEREACAKVADSKADECSALANRHDERGEGDAAVAQRGQAKRYRELADQIRSRGDA